SSGAGSVVIDSVSDLEASAYDQERFASYMYSLIQYGKDRRLSLFMTMEHNETQQPGGWTPTNVSRMADNVIHLGNARQGKRMQREMRVVKTRGSEHDHDVHDVDISARGFVVSAAPAREG
ncbi:MAG TPA: ATPase domain-containing protein, partial [Candidatus Thermoplasmatota archaeon]|nr:ATPase domain-containing protein [Candidatus Thermoplasmatota archaeon]